MFGPQGDKSMQSKYSVDNAGYGQGTSRDEFGTFTGGKTLMGKTNNYVERMENKISDLTDFFSERIEDFDPNNIDDDMIDQMNKFNGFYTKQFQAYKNRIATEKINTDFAKEQAAKKAEAAKAAAARDIALYAEAERTGDADAASGAGGNVDPGGPASRMDWSDLTDDEGDKYATGGVASMFTRRR